MTDIDVYPVGLLAALQHDVRRLRHPRLAWTWRMDTPRTLRYLAGRIRKGEWRAAKNTFNGYLAEPTEFWPKGVRRCGSGWTRRRALRSLARQYAAAGACPHGYERGDHHWYGCMGVSPFEEIEP